MLTDCRLVRHHVSWVRRRCRQPSAPPHVDRPSLRNHSWDAQPRVGAGDRGRGVTERRPRLRGRTRHRTRACVRLTQASAVRRLCSACYRPGLPAGPQPGTVQGSQAGDDRHENAGTDLVAVDVVDVSAERGSISGPAEVPTPPSTASPPLGLRGRSCPGGQTMSARDPLAAVAGCVVLRSGGRGTWVRCGHDGRRADSSSRRMPSRRGLESPPRAGGARRSHSTAEPPVTRLARRTRVRPEHGGTAECCLPLGRRGHRRGDGQDRVRLVPPGQGQSLRPDPGRTPVPEGAQCRLPHRSRSGQRRQGGCGRPRAGRSRPRGWS